MKIKHPTRRKSMHALAALLPLLMFAQSAQSLEDRGVPLKSPVPVDPIAGIIEAFKSHDVVALSEGSHNNEQAHTLRLQLVRDPRFAEAVNDIVVEFGNARFQALMDRFVQGETVPHSDLQRVWQDTTVANRSWDVPIYEEFFRAVRDVNLTLPVRQRVRVVLGDPPIDWDQIKSREEWEPWLSRRDSHAAEVIQREVLSKQRKALVVYGGGHFARKKVFWNISNKALAQQRFEQPNNSLLALLERAGARVFAIYTNTDEDLVSVEPGVAEWAAPKLAITAGTSLDRFYPWVTYMTVDKEKGIEERAEADRERSPSMSELFDAILYLGPPASITMSKLPASLCADSEYMKMREHRSIVTAAPAFAAEAGRALKNYCSELWRR